MRRTAFIACVSLMAGALPAQTSTSKDLANTANSGVKVIVLPPSPKTHEPLRYVLSEPAYVAAFIVYPGSGVRLLYPLVDQPEQLQRAGYNVNDLIGKSFDDDFYRVVLGPRLDGPAYLYVIASRSPLDVSRYVHSPMRLASAVGEKDSRSFYAHVAFDAIVNNAISLGDDASWDAGVYMLWPPSVTERQLARADQNAVRNTQFVLVDCSDGTSRELPANYPFKGCPGDMKVVPVATPKTPPPQTTASAKTQTSAPAASTGGAANLVVGANSPTVLPTIIGKRVSDQERREAIAREGAAQSAQGVRYTSANGDEAVAPARANSAPSVTVAPGIQMQAIDRPGSHARAEHERPSGDRSRDRLSGDRTAHRRAGEVVGGSPKLPPNPRLSPNPGLSPSPGVGSSAPRSSAPTQSQQMQARDAMRAPRVQPSGH